MSGARLNLWTGAALIGGAAGGFAGVALPLAAVGLPPDDPTAADRIRLLQDIRANDLAYLAGFALDGAANVLLVVQAPLLYLLLRGRDRVLASLSAAMLAAAGVVLMLVTVLGFSGHSLASDLPEGLPSDAQQLGAAIEGSTGLTVIAAFAGSSASLSEYGSAIGLAFFGLGLIALGLLLARSPRAGAATAAASAVPAWIGWLTIAAGVLLALAWPSLAEPGLGAITLAGFALTILAAVALGGWLLRAAGEPAAFE